MTEQNGANFLVSLKNNAEYDKPWDVRGSFMHWAGGGHQQAAKTGIDNGRPSLTLIFTGPILS